MLTVYQQLRSVYISAIPKSYLKMFLVMDFGYQNPMFRIMSTGILSNERFKTHSVPP